MGQRPATTALIASILIVVGSATQAGAAPHEKGGGASIDVALTAPDSVTKGDEFSYDATVRTGGTALDNVNLTDALPSGVRYVSVTSDRGTCRVDGNHVTCALGRLERRTEALVRITVVAEVVGTVTNTVDVTGTANGAQRSGTASATTSIAASPTADPSALRVTFTGPPQPALVGTALTYTATITNDGSAAPLTVGFYAYDNWWLGQQLIESFTASQGTCSDAPATYADVFGFPPPTPLARTPSCSLGTLATGQTVTLKAVVRTTSPTTEDLPLFASLGEFREGSPTGVQLGTVETVVTTGNAVVDCSLTDPASFTNVDRYVACATSR